MLKLVKFGCGCIGFSEPIAERTHVVLQACDASPYSSCTACFSFRTTLHPENISNAIPLTATEVQEFRLKIAKLIADGERWQELKAALLS